MIRISCDNCERTIEVDPEVDGDKIACPHCGDINRVPEAAEPAPSRPEREAPPVRAGGEEEICTVRPAMFRAHPFRFLMIAALLVLGLIAAGYAMFAEPPRPWLGWVGLGLTVAAVVWYAGWWVSTYFWRKLIVSNKRTIRHEGVITRHTTEVLHDHVRSVDIRQTFVQRIFNVGSVGIDSAGQDGIEIEMRDIPRPYRVKEIIDRYRKM